MNTKKILALALAAVLLMAMTVAGTMAYLQAESTEVTNIFNRHEVDVELTEKTGTSYDLIPGQNETKDPKVTVTNTVDAYVFLVVDESKWVGENLDGIVYYNIASGWTELEDGVYYREVSAGANGEYQVIEDDTVYITKELTESNMPAANVELSFEAYIIQKAGFGTASAAWNEIKARTDKGTQYYVAPTTDGN